jgi:cytidyltransferase-like protein
MKVFVNGVFDILTVGHFNLLMKCRDIVGPDGKIYVAIDEDEKVMADKGLQRPIFNVHERAKALLDLRMPNDKSVIDEICFFETNLVLEMVIKRIRPDYIVKGSDWQGKVVIGSQYAKVVYMDRLISYSTTEIIRRCQEKNAKAQ